MERGGVFGLRILLSRASVAVPALEDRRDGLPVVRVDFDGARTPPRPARVDDGLGDALNALPDGRGGVWLGEEAHGSVSLRGGGVSPALEIKGFAISSSRHSTTKNASENRPFYTLIFGRGGGNFDKL